MTEFSVNGIPAPADTTAVSAVLKTPSGVTVSTLALNLSEDAWAGSVNLDPVPTDSLSPYTYSVIATTGHGSVIIIPAGTTYGYMTGGTWYESANYLAYLSAVGFWGRSKGGQERTLVAFQSSRLTHDWQIEADTGVPQDLTGHSFEFVCHEPDADGVVFSVDSDGGRITLVASDPDNADVLDLIVLSVPDTVIDDSLLGKYQYKLRDLTADLVYGTGTLLVRLAPIV